jgi:hypothetical protein
MLIDASDEVVGNPEIDRSVPPAGKEILARRET